MVFPLALTVAKGAIDVAVNANKAAGFFKTLETSDEEAFFFWRMLDALHKPLQTAIALCRRHVALSHLYGSVELCRYTVAKCEAVMVREENEDDDEPEDAQSWSKWLNHKRGGFSRLQHMKDLLPKLQMCQQALSLSLSAIPLQIPARFLQPRAAFEFTPDAMEDAIYIIQQFEFGRVGADGSKVGVGNLYEKEQLSAQPAGAARRRVAIWKERGARTCLLVKGEGSDAYSLRFEPMRGVQAETGRESDDETTASVGLPLVKGARLKRGWLSDIPDLQCDRDDSDRVAYHIGEQLVFAFDAVGAVSAEVFEGLLCMAKRLDGSPDSSGCVAEVLDLDESPAAWRREMEGELGEFADDSAGADEVFSSPGLGSQLGRLRI